MPINIALRRSQMAQNNARRAALNSDRAAVLYGSGSGSGFAGQHVIKADNLQLVFDDYVPNSNSNRAMNAHTPRPKTTPASLGGAIHFPNPGRGQYYLLSSRF
ncbi:hypothetical protein V5O48_016046 [Marasmius crinis-equi]|uniref:Uncharacterized protein n=1 Tax=Marasmius crinis-equi TaxID=585013 RepID=A0ABR3ESU1_9AGAR